MSCEITLMGIVLAVEDVAGSADQDPDQSEQHHASDQEPPHPHRAISHTPASLATRAALASGVGLNAGDDGEGFRWRTATTPLR